MSWLDDCEGYRDDMKLCKRGYCSAKMKYKKYPSAYANLHASSVCQGKVADYGGETRADPEYMRKLQNAGDPKDNDLKRWLAEKWVNVCERDSEGNYKPCGRSKSSGNQKSKFPYCRPSIRVSDKTPKTVKELTKAELKKLCLAKRELDNEEGKEPKRVFVKQQSKE